MYLDGRETIDLSREIIRLPGGSRFRIWKQILLIVCMLLAAVFLYDGYRKAETYVLTDYSERLGLYARQVAFELEFFLEHIHSELLSLVESPEIIYLGEKGRKTMGSFLDVHQSMIRAVTRMDSSGTIVYTFPEVEGAIGADISGQEHVQEILTTHETVFSDAFFAVQGYWAVTVHVPVFDQLGNFYGTLAAVIPFREAMVMTRPLRT